jgi:ATP-dependent DNA ligase
VPTIQTYNCRDFRISARKNGSRARLYSRPSNDLTQRYPLISEAVLRLRSRSHIIRDRSRPMTLA